MREIKFRAWNESICEMVDLHKITPLALSDTMNTQLAIQNMDGLFIPFSSQFDLMQYTGLKDKNGVEIYEGDILSNKDYIEDAHCCFDLGNKIVEWNNECGCWLGIEGEIFEVIGNIYENPELLSPSGVEE